MWCRVHANLLGLELHGIHALHAVANRGESGRAARLQHIELIFGGKGVSGGTAVEPAKVKQLWRSLEQTLGSREQWRVPVLRELWGTLHAGAGRRRRSAEHERIWFQLSGYTLRPGFGYPLDEWRCEQTAALFARQPDYEAWAWEIHHAAKKDAPSGTLRRLADDMRAAGYDRPITLSANRAGAHPGTHEIGFDSVADTITLRHTARSREGFARGALQAARWVSGKRGVFEFRDILTELGAVEAKVTTNSPA